MGKGHVKAVFMATLSVFVLWSAKALAGDPEAGRRYFFGQRPFANNGPACGKCHSVKGAGAGSAPELGMFCNDPANCGLIEAGWINSSTDPKMQKSYGANPVTDDEAAHLRAFLEKAVK